MPALIGPRNTTCDITVMLVKICGQTVPTVSSRDLILESTTQRHERQEKSVRRQRRRSGLKTNQKVSQFLIIQTLFLTLFCSDIAVSTSCFHLFQFFSHFTRHLQMLSSLKRGLKSLQRWQQ